MTLLYDNGKPDALVVETAAPLVLDTACARCALNKPDLRSPCLSGELGERGGLLVIGESPARLEDTVGRPFIAQSGERLRTRLPALGFPDGVTFDNAIRCSPGREEGTEKSVAACRGYLAATFAEIRPSRVLCLGALAAFSVAGRKLAPLSTRRAYTFTSYGAPVFFVVHPAAALRNAFVNSWFESDLKWALTANPRQPPWSAQVNEVTTVAEAEAAVREVVAGGRGLFDVETSGVMWNADFELLCLTISTEDGARSWTWPKEALTDMNGVVAPLFEWLTSTAPKGGQNVKFDALAVESALGVRVRGIDSDTRLKRKLLEPDAAAKLEVLQELVGMGGGKEQADEEIGVAVKRTRRYILQQAKDAKLAAESAISRSNVKPARAEKLVPASEVDPVFLGAIQAKRPVMSYAYRLLSRDTLHRYNARDAVSTALLDRELDERLAAEPALLETWRDIVLPAALAITHVERWGVGVDRAALLAFQQHLDQRATEASAILAKFGNTNWASAPQLRKLLFDELRLPIIEETDTGLPSTNAKTLAKLAAKHPLPAALQDFRFVTKMKGTYADGLIQHVRDDGRIHPSFNLDGARSGRTSADKPNLQNIPRKDTPEGRMARDCFVAAPGCVLIEIDYSQLELRVAAMLSQDPVMTALFQSGADFHLETAKLVSMMAWGIEPEDVTSEHRTKAKAVNFGTLYGKTARTFAEEWGCSIALAQRIVDAILGRFKHLQRWRDDRVRETRRSGEAWTEWAGRRARRRPLWRIRDKDPESVSVAEHGAVNTPIQGTASDFLIKSLTELVGWIVDDGVPAKLVLPVHDSIMFEARKDVAQEVLDTARAVMVGWPSYGVPLEVDAKIGRSWGSLEKAA